MLPGRQAMMETPTEGAGKFQLEDHEGAYIFRPGKTAGPPADRPSKRRRTSQDVERIEESPSLSGNGSLFVPLLGGAESPTCVQLREKVFEQSWAAVEGRVQAILRNANAATLDEVTSFVREANMPSDKLPSAFIITGTNIASQAMLFEQLAEGLRTNTRSRVVRLRSADAPNLKAVLKKVIQDATSSGGLGGDDDEETEVSHGKDGRKYLNYDLEGLSAFVAAQGCERVFVAFEDSEGFDSALLSDLIVLFHSWLPRIPFTLLFGVATSVELLQARLLKSSCGLVYGAQFDVVQTDTILEQVFRPAVAGADVVLRLGPRLLQGLIDRQHDQVAGIHTFLSSLKYAYMCHFYANPLSLFAAEDEGLTGEVIQGEHLEAFRQLASFRQGVEAAVEEGRLDHARSSLQDDEFLRVQILGIPARRRLWTLQTLRALALLGATGVVRDTFSQLYLQAAHDGVSLGPDGFDVIPSIRRLQPDDLVALLERVLDVMTNGDAGLGLEGWADSTPETRERAAGVGDEIRRSRELMARARDKGGTLRSSWAGQGRVLRTTVVAQKVQLSRESAALSDEDKEFAALVDRAVGLLGELVVSEPATTVPLHEAWFYDSRTPHRDVFVPRPRGVVERALLRPYDYLACSCCTAADGGISTTLPVTSLLYHLYLEAGSIINVADLWAAFLAMVGGGEGAKSADAASGGHDERTALMLFYKGLAELKALGFVKPSRKKVDHVAKLKWL